MIGHRHAPAGRTRKTKTSRSLVLPVLFFHDVESSCSPFCFDGRDPRASLSRSSGHGFSRTLSPSPSPSRGSGAPRSGSRHLLRQIVRRNHADARAESLRCFYDYAGGVPQAAGERGYHVVLRNTFLRNSFLRNCFFRFHTPAAAESVVLIVPPGLSPANSRTNPHAALDSLHSCW